MPTQVRALLANFPAKILSSGCFTAVFFFPGTSKPITYVSIYTRKRKLRKTNLRNQPSIVSSKLRYKNAKAIGFINSLVSPYNKWI